MIRSSFLRIAIINVCTTLCVAMETDRHEQLIDATRQGDTEKVKLLLAEGVDVNARDRFDITAAWQAAHDGNDKLLRFLVQNGADVNIPDSVWHMSPFLMVRDPELVVFMMNHDAQAVEGKLNSAALYGDLKLVQAIVETGKIDHPSLSQAAIHARYGNHDEIVKFLQDASSKQLLPPKSVSTEVLRSYAGEYFSERLNPIEVLVRDGRLFLKEGDRPEIPLVTLNANSFVCGATQFQFDVKDAKLAALIRNDVYNSRRYIPRSVALHDRRPGSKSPSILTNDAPRIVARERWPSFRGIEARGIAVDQHLPDNWDIETGRNIRWRIPIAGLAHSCPIIWDGKVFVSTAVSESERNDLKIGLYGATDAVDDQSKHSWRLICLDATSGEVLWRRTAYEGVPTVKRHLKSTQANSTPATDGRHVVVLFNSGGLYCYDIDGKPLWNKQLGILNSGAFRDPEIQWGFGSSPIIYRNMVIVQCDLYKNSYVAAFHIDNGAEIWNQARDEPPSWGSPTVFESPYGALLLTNGTNFARGYDALSGRERWRLGGNSAVTVPTPLVAYDLVFITSGYRPIQPIFAVRLDAHGDISITDGKTNTGIAWSKQRGGPYLPTPLAYGGYIYTCGNNGVLTCYEAKSGKKVYRKRASRGNASSFTASPVAADGRIFLTAESGEVLILKAGPEFEILGQSSLGEYALATPAISGGALFARTQNHLVAIGKQNK